MTQTSCDSYEIGFGAESGWRAITESEELPQWDFVAGLLHARIDEIMHKTQATSYQLYLTEGRTFRFDLATVKPYKGNRKENKPWHYDNLTAYMIGQLQAELVTHIEADDKLAIEHLADSDTIICSRDKDLRQVPGWFYSWELGRQPEYGPVDVSPEGELVYEDGKLTGNGFAFFCAQVLMGDSADNIPGLPKIGPKGAHALLNACSGTEWLLSTVEAAYQVHYGSDWEERLLEQGRLLWMTRRLHSDGSPVLWELGMIE